MGVYRLVYPRHTSKEVIYKLLIYLKICYFSLLEEEWKWTTQKARADHEKRNWKYGAPSKQIIISDE